MRLKQSDNKFHWFVVDDNDEIVYISTDKVKAITALRELMWTEAKRYKGKR